MTPEQIKHCRYINNLTQRTLAETVGVSLRNVQYWESGENKIPKYVTIILQEKGYL